MGGIGTHAWWKEQDNALHAWTPLCSKYRAPKSANNDGIGGKKETVTTTSRCRFTMRSISRRRLRKLTPRLYSGRFYNRRGEHEIPSRRRLADRPTRWFAPIPFGSCRQQKIAITLRDRDDKALICGSHARPCTAPCTHTWIFRRSFARYHLSR